MNRYDRLKYSNTKANDPYNWIGNLRWYMTEEKEGTFSFRCISCLPNMSHEESVAINMTKRLFEINLSNVDCAPRKYGADYLETNHFTAFFPFHEYGSLLCVDKDIKITYEGKTYEKEDCCVIQNGFYYIAFRMNAPYENNDQGIDIQIKDKQWIAVAFHIEEEKAIADCKRLFEEQEQVLEDNRTFWNTYLESCPVVEIGEDYNYKHPTLPIKECFSNEDFVTRQLWHYWCLLVNVSEVEFNKLPIYMAPDKINWIGTWSNDGPQCMATLSLTNQKDLSRKIIVYYLKHAMTNDGEFSWYMHADGTGCYGIKGDVGRFSHGDPYMPHVVEYYIRNTGDDTILQEDAGGVTVYEKLKTYMLNLHSLRDINQDSLIEWSNLWETGWDDKGGTFFTSASLEEWMENVSKGTDAEIEEFYKQHQRPVMAIVEQVITLWALSAMAKLARMQHDHELEEYCQTYYEKMKQAVNTRCWNEKDGFYYDIDIKSETQTTEKSADAFFWLNFESNHERSEKLLNHLNDENEFNCYYIPMLSKDSKGFNQFGYWSGGHWPREMSIIAMGLHHCGYDDKAMELLVRAIMSDEGNVIAEVIEPLEGQRSTKITKMACAVMNVVALLDISDRVVWSRDEK